VALLTPHDASHRRLPIDSYIFLLITLIAIFIDQRSFSFASSASPCGGATRASFEVTPSSYETSNTPKRPPPWRAQVAHHPPSRLPELDQQHRDRGDVLGRRRDPLLSALGFLGLGIQAPQTDWGTMLQAGTSQIQNGFWWEIYPLALVFILVVVSINYIGDALRDCFEVRLLER